MAVTREELENWLCQFEPSDQIGIDNDGAGLKVAGHEDMPYGYFTIGFLPEGGDESVEKN